MSRPRGDRPERLLAVATTGLPADRSAWGEAMRAELESIEQADDRRRFAYSAARSVAGQGLAARVCLGLLAGILTTATAVMASRLQLAAGGPGLLPVTVPVPAGLLLAAALLAAAATRSFRLGLQAGIIALGCCALAVLGVLAVEGLVWMDRLGVFILDGDPPRGTIGTADVVLDVFSTGLWVGHVVMWLPSIVLGAALGAVRGRRPPAGVEG